MVRRHVPRPQHFQQHDRYLETLVDGRCRSLLAGGWGFPS
ncbi:type VI secretion system baseplate subunit TssK [Pseudomonas aeruginosa]